MRSVSHRLPIADLWNSTLLPAENSERLDLEFGILMGKSELRRFKKDDPLNTCNGARKLPRIHISTPESVAHCSCSGEILYNESDQIEGSLLDRVDAYCSTMYCCGLRFLM